MFVHKFKAKQKTCGFFFISVFKIICEIIFLRYSSKKLRLQTEKTNSCRIYNINLGITLLFTLGLEIWVDCLHWVLDNLRSSVAQNQSQLKFILSITFVANTYIVSDLNFTINKVYKAYILFRINILVKLLFYL